MIKIIRTTQLASLFLALRIQPLTALAHAKLVTKPNVVPRNLQETVDILHSIKYLRKRKKRGGVGGGWGGGGR